jgi:hypothetical protein
MVKSSTQAGNIRSGSNPDGVVAMDFVFDIWNPLKSPPDTTNQKA